MKIKMDQRMFLGIMSDSRLISDKFSINGAHVLYDLITELEEKLPGFEYEFHRDKIALDFKQHRGTHIVNLYEIETDDLILSQCGNETDYYECMADFAERWLSKKTFYKRFHSSSKCRDNFVYLRKGLEL